MNARMDIDDQRRQALERIARRNRLSLRRALERAVDEFIERAEDEDLLLSSARTARRTGLREGNAVEIVSAWRNKGGKKA